MKRKLLALLLCLALFLSAVPGAALAAGRDTSYEKTLAQDLKALGLFRGVSDTDFALDRAPTRVEALIMLIRLLGQEDEALASSYKHPFRDVPAWADKYVGYAYHEKLSNGISATQFGSGKASAEMYLTFVLRALGYSDKNGADFVWSDPYALAEKVGILPAAVDRKNFLRADVVLVSYAALAAKEKGSVQRLAEKLIAEKVFSRSAFLINYDPDAIARYGSGAAQDPDEIYWNCAPAVFHLDAFDRDGSITNSGSGFFIEKQGVAVTCYQLIAGATSASITVPDSGKSYAVLGVYDYDADANWAVIKVDGSGFQTLSPGTAATAGKDAAVYALGSPTGQGNSFSQGTVTYARRVLGGTAYIQHKAAISYASGGGALLNKNGEAVGILDSSVSAESGQYFALPIELIRNYANFGLIRLEDLARETANGSGSGHNSAQEQAFKLLARFLEDEANYTQNGKPAYRQQAKTNEGYCVLMLVRESEDRIAASYDELMGEESYHTELILSPGSQECPLYYNYEELDTDTRLSGSAQIYAPAYDKGKNISFDSVSGNAQPSTGESICAIQLLDILYFIDEIFSDYIGSHSVKDLGFTLS